MTRAVIFDFYGTLVRPAAPTRTIVELMMALGVTIPDHVAQRWDIDHLDGVDHHQASVSEVAYREWEDQRWGGMLADCGVSEERRIPIVDAIRAQVRSFRVAAFDESAAVLADVRRQGLTVAICSNWHWDLDPYVAEAGLADLVDVSLTSARLGARKDHPVVYERTLDAVGATPDEAVFVGDSWRPDVLGPLRAGMTAIHVHRDDRRPAPSLPDGAHRVSDLRGVPPLL